MKRLMFIHLFTFGAMFYFVGCAFKEQTSIQETHYVIQVGSFSSLHNAGQLINNLNSNGLNAFYFKENGYYKVRFGSYASKAQAEQNAQKYRKAGLIGSFFVINPKQYAINATQKKQIKITKAREIRQDIIKTAKAYIGTPYKWGGINEKGFDCSGFTKYIYEINDILIPRTSFQQFEVGLSISKDMLQEGDLVFFMTNNSKRINHVGIYIGNDEFIHAPRKGKTVSIANLNAKYWTKAYAGARNYL